MQYSQQCCYTPQDLTWLKPEKIPTQYSQQCCYTPQDLTWLKPEKIPVSRLCSSWSTAHTRPIPHGLQLSTKPHSCPPSSSSSSDTSLAVKILRETCRALTHISAWLSGSRRRGQQWRRLRELTRISSAFWTACRSVGKLRILHSLSSSKSDRISCSTTHREYLAQQRTYTAVQT